MKLVLQIAGGILLAAILVAGLVIGGLALMSHWTQSEIDRRTLDACADLGIPADECRLRN